MYAEEFKRMQKRLGWTTSQTAHELKVSRYAVMHWRAGRRAVPDIALVAMRAIEDQKRLQFLHE